MQGDKDVKVRETDGKSDRRNLQKKGMNVSSMCIEQFGESLEEMGLDLVLRNGSHLGCKSGDGVHA